MGCSSSKQKLPATASVPISIDPGFMKTNAKSPFTLYDAATSPKELHLQGEIYNYTLKYIYGSQRGFYPDSKTNSLMLCKLLFMLPSYYIGLDKANQDSFLVCENVLKDDNCHVFGVFDGHGRDGDACSHFAASNVSKM